MLGGFKKFAMRGNVVDMAAGIIIGAAFGKIIRSLVKNVIMPPIGIMMGNVNFPEVPTTTAGLSRSRPSVGACNMMRDPHDSRRTELRS